MIATEGIPHQSEADFKVIELQAEICRTLANPKRLQIVNLLKNGELSVGEIVRAMGIPKSNASQHLSVTRQKGLIVSRRVGTTIFYRLASPKITEACSLMREVLLSLLVDRETLSRKIRGASKMP
ncbi:MAG TPA: metalloregulator ArsR/SmtB family transcription factor [Syntrophorhabdales bacterium]|nr:metalloregulator ArsR/SmtB family transcription factor [Syntrophorhabdales bacterium]